MSWEIMQGYMNFRAVIRAFGGITEFIPKPLAVSSWIYEVRMVLGFLWLLGLRGFYCLRLVIELNLPPKLVGNM